MRLIDTSTLKLEELGDCSDVKYAILSHRWEEEEVSFQKFQAGAVESTHAKGYGKIVMCCRQALRDGLSYAWIDTCCIDKSSSAELSEAINSMFRWYQESTICYAYLSDCLGYDPSSFTRSQWFTRGWTLQELLAPKHVVFFDREWEQLGEKQNLVPEIRSATGIDEDALRGANLFQFKVAKRMGWASGRRTTRLEDRAYSLMDLFDVNMALLYGEGAKAFVRLQEEIIKHSSDHSIFGWTGVPHPGSGLLASTPDQFTDRATKVISSQVDKIFGQIARTDDGTYSVTNRGLRISLWLAPHGLQTYMAILPLIYSEAGYSRPGVPQRVYVCICLERMHEPDQYQRVNFGESGLAYHTNTYLRQEPFRRIVVNIRQDSSKHGTTRHFSMKNHSPLYGFRVSGGQLSHYQPIVEGSSVGQHREIKVTPGAGTNVARSQLVHIPRPGGTYKLLFGFDFDFNPVCVIYPPSCPLSE